MTELQRQFVEGCGIIETAFGIPIHEPIIVMSPEDIKHRDALNIANTASAKRAAVVAELIKTNGRRQDYGTGFR